MVFVAQSGFQVIGYVYLSQTGRNRWRQRALPHPVCGSNDLRPIIVHGRDKFLQHQNDSLNAN